MSTPQDRTNSKLAENLGFFTAFFITTTIFYYLYPRIHSTTSWTFTKAIIIISIITLTGLWLKHKFSN